MEFQQLFEVGLSHLLIYAPKEPDRNPLYDPDKEPCCDSDDLLTSGRMKDIGAGMLSRWFRLKRTEIRNVGMARNISCEL